MRHHGAAIGEIRPAAPVSGGDEPAVGIDPATGTDMLLALLAARTPEQVVVRPFRDGRPARPAPAGADVTPVESPPAADTDTVVAEQSTPADRTPVGERLRTLWGQTLGVEDIESDDDFFDLGGDSLSAIDLMAGIRDTFGVELTIGTLFERSTLAELIALIEQGGS
jgi:phthiocerol/phenolphthiocerol synthesis type-I polyketide synthase E